MSGPFTRGRRDWADWAPGGAALWSLTYAALGSWWTTGRGEFPFGAGPTSGPAASFLSGLPEAVGAPVVAALGLIGAAVGLRILRSDGSGAVPAPWRAFAWIMAVVLLLVVPDGRAIAVAAYAPFFLIGVPFGWPPGSFWQQVTWPIRNQYVCVLGGSLWAATALVASRRARGSCVACGRRSSDAAGRTRAAARRWGAWAVATAVVMPLPYAATRMAWAFGVPMGLHGEDLIAVRDTGSFFPAGALASVAIAGALFTLGLTRRWGEVLPVWLPRVGGRRVPPALAVVPAAVVAVLVCVAGLGAAREWAKARLRGEPGLALDIVGLVWPLWGAALGIAALAYHMRTRGRCRRCGRA